MEQFRAWTDSSISLKAKNSLVNLGILNIEPDIDVPNINLGNIQQQMSESITSHMIDRVKITVSELIIKACFLLCLKAVLSFYMCEALSTTLTIMAALFVPGLNLITYVLLWIFIGLCALIRRFRKPKVEMNFEGVPQNG